MGKGWIVLPAQLNVFDFLFNRGAMFFAFYCTGARPVKFFVEKSEAYLTGAWPHLQIQVLNNAVM